jgi:hypothetical protein
MPHSMGYRIDCAACVLWHLDLASTLLSCILVETTILFRMLYATCAEEGEVPCCYGR